MNASNPLPGGARKRRVARVIGTLLVVIGIIAFGAYVAFRSSLPRLDGEVGLTGLRSPVTIERDSNGVPTVRATNRRDLARATGYVHAQDRFFQMDLQRRLSAGELSELLGPATLPTDRSLRRHQFSRVADQVIAAATPAERDLLEAYAEGVNQALADLGARPWEYIPLSASPRPWQARDSLLVAFAMYIDLNDTTGERELVNAALKAALPEALLPVLSPLGSEWDAPVDGGTWRAPPLPGPDVLDLRRGPARVAALTAPTSLRMTGQTGDAALGSNSWAVAGSQTADGGAILANDMHLGLQVPNIWYRARLIVSPAGGEPVDLVGVTLPGLPIVVAGSNTHVAWGFTNTHGDWTDLVVVNVDPQDPTRYVTTQGPKPFEKIEEVIRVRGEADQSLAITRTEWGPVIAMDSAGRPLALSWTAHRPEATNLRMLGFETAKTAQEALQVANESGAPVQNILVADSAGNIGWTLFGQIPVREGYDSRFPADWSKPATGWTRWRRADEIPHVLNPLGGRLWTANTRTITASTWLDFVGPGAYVLGARAGQIRDALLAQRDVTARDMVAIQLDDRALFLARWRDLLLQVLAPAALQGNEPRQTAKKLVEAWSGRAAVEDPGYLIVRNFRLAVLAGTFDGLTATARVSFPDMKFEPGQQFEGSAWQLVTERPLHLLDPRFANWDSALLAWLDGTLARIEQDCGALQDCGWGRSNVLAMRHPLSRAMPWASWLIDMPAIPLPGDTNMPRVQGPRQGASERLVVSPGREAEGLFQMPGGQSSHPLSSFYRAGHDAWLAGQPEPLLPGPAVRTLTLVPRAAQP